MVPPDSFVCQCATVVRLVDCSPRMAVKAKSRINTKSAVLSDVSDSASIMAVICTMANPLTLSETSTKPFACESIAGMAC